MESYHWLLLNLRRRLQEDLCKLNGLKGFLRQIIASELTIPLFDTLHSQLLSQLMNKLEK